MKTRWPRRRIKLFCLWWIGLFLYYWWLIGESKLQQFLAGTVIAAATAFALDRVREKFGLQFQMKARWGLVLLQRIPGQVMKDLWLLITALWQGARGGTRHRGLVKEIEVNSGGIDPLSAGRRALLVTGISFAPNTYVISLDREQGKLAQHQLVPRDKDLKDKEWPL